jgi:hypothetical protein
VTFVPPVVAAWEVRGSEHDDTARVAAERHQIPVPGQ